MKIQMLFIGIIRAQRAEREAVGDKVKQSTQGLLLKEMVGT